MTRLHLLAICGALAFAPALAFAADMPVAYPPQEGVAQFPAPADGVPVGQEGVTGKLVRYAVADSNLPAHGTASRIKDIAQLQSARDNQLIGYGLVIGLAGLRATACATRLLPSSRSAPCLRISASRSEGGRARAKNVAAVIVTANMPPFVQSGARIDVSVSSLGDATSLAGGTLVMTPLKAADGEIYAVAQGPVIFRLFRSRPGRGADPGRSDRRPRSQRRDHRAPGGCELRQPVDIDPAAAEMPISPPPSGSPTPSMPIPACASADASRRSRIHARSSFASRRTFRRPDSMPRSRTWSSRPTRRRASSSTNAPAPSSSAATCGSRASPSATAR